MSKPLLVQGWGTKHSSSPINFSICGRSRTPARAIVPDLAPSRFLGSKGFHFPAPRPVASVSTMQAATPDAVLTTAPPKPAEEPAGMDASAALLQSFASIPSLAKAWAFPNTGVDGVRVALQMSQRNLGANAQRKYITNFLLNEAVLEAGEADTSLPLDLCDALAVSPSPSGRRLLIVRPAPNGDTSTAAVLEIWDRSRVIREIHVPSALHGAVYNDGWFGSGATWTPDESAVAYVAEAPPGTKTPEWGGAPKGPDGEKPEGAGPKAWRGLGAAQEDWGELNTGKRPPTLFVADIPTGEVAAVQGLPADASAGQPQWSPDGKALIFVAWPHASSNFPEFPRRLGIVFCFNRPCALFAVAWPQPKERGAAASAVRISPASLRSAFSPRFSPDGKMLVALSQAAAVESGAHAATPALLAFSWTDIAPAIAASTAAGSAAGAPPPPLPPPRTVVDIVWNPAGPDDFPGLYCNVLPEQPFVGGSDTLVATIQWRSNFAVVAVDLPTGAVRRLSPANGSSWSLLGAGGDWMLATESHPGLPQRLFAAHVAPAERGRPEAWGWSRVTLPDADALPNDVSEALAQLETKIVHVTPTTGPTDLSFEAVILRRRDLTGPLPTVLTPHGGPHTAYPAQYFMPMSFMAASGWCIVLVNYRGSTGFGEASLQSLPGHIGTYDVADCMDALRIAIESGDADPARVAAVGGSHGGFLSSHLVGQHPEAFQAAVLRNPVCNLALMVHLSDIPDWCYVEAMGSEEGRKRAAAGPGPEDLQRFAEVSPIRYASAVSAPIMMMLGACDRRVPMDDGKRYLDAVRGRGPGAPETRLTVFPKDAHGLDKPQTEFEQWITALWWLERHVLGKKDELAA